MTFQPTEPTGPRGRGAWPAAGTGGTLVWNGIAPGRYYALAAPGMEAVGSGGWRSASGDERAVRGAVVAIQRGLNRRISAGLDVTGLFDQPTSSAATRFRLSVGLDGWGGVGPTTAKALFLPDLQVLCKKRGIEQWEVVCGVVQNESAWDPGAVGYVKPVDLGLAQINGDAHPDMSERDRLKPPFAFDFVISYLLNAMKALDGNLDDAIASYNLGISGCKRWISQGRPEMYTPPGSVPRNVPAYIDRIHHACVESLEPVRP